MLLYGRNICNNKLLVGNISMVEGGNPLLTRGECSRNMTDSTYSMGQQVVGNDHRKLCIIK